MAINLTRRMLQRIDLLSGEFGKCSAVGPLLFHVLVAFTDDLNDVAIGPNGLIKQEGTLGSIALPGISARQIIVTHGIKVITPPIWTEHGKRYGADSAYWMLPAARKLLVTKPGVVAHSCTLTEGPTKEACDRRERLFRLASDAGRLVYQFRDSFSAAGIVDYERAGGRDADLSRWLLTLHRLSWRNDPESGLHSVRYTWGAARGQVAFFPFDAESLRHLKSVPPIAEQMRGVRIPPDRYVSVLDQDLFVASLYGLRDMLSIVASDTRPESIVAPLPSAPSRRDSIFVSYAHPDEKWLLELDAMLAPAVRDRTVKLWHDRNIKPGEMWQSEIAQQLAVARVGVLLVTKNFFDSKYIQDVELRYLLSAAKTNGVPLLWIAVDHCMYEHTPLKELQALNEPEKPWSHFRGASRQKAIKMACQKIVDAYGPTD